MSQAYPQFTPVQILEAGQRAFAEGRTEYATQFFKHLIDHYSDTAEAAVAREALAQAHGTSTQSATPRYAQSPVNANGNGNGHYAEPSAQASPSYARPGTSNGAPQGIQLSVDGQSANGHANGRSHAYGAEGHAAPRYDTEQHAYQAPLQPGESIHSRAPLGPRPTAQYRQEPARAARPAPTIHSVTAPAPEKSYIIGRVVAGLLLLFGILGIFAGIVLVYAAITDPGIFTGFGLATPMQALTFSGAVLIGSIMALIVAQAATALFDGADAVADLARLERYRVGDSVDDDD